MLFQSNEVVEDFVSHHKEKKETGGNTEGNILGNHSVEHVISVKNVDILLETVQSVKQS